VALQDEAPSGDLTIEGAARARGRDLSVKTPLLNASFTGLGHTRLKYGGMPPKLPSVTSAPMSEVQTTSFSEPPASGHPHDLLALLYREIGISAVAAALEAISKPETPAGAPVELTVPAVLRSDDLAA